MNNIYGFWISPQSEIHPIFDDFGHKKFIENLLKESVDATDSPENSLFDEGWIRIVNTNKSLMVNYKCITSRMQLKAIEEIENSLLREGYFHEQYILDYGYDYHFFDSLKGLLNRIKERLYYDKFE